MSRENIADQLIPRGITLSNLVYSAELVSVYQGNYHQFPAAIKVQHCRSQEFGQMLEREFETLLQLVHPNIMKVYDCFWTENEGHRYLVFVVEWCSKDLGKDMTQRKTNSFPWKEEDLWVAIGQMVSALAYMQRRGFAHRDIKPANIFLMPNNEVKIGDLGSALRRDPNSAETPTPIVGTPAFFSPVLREAFKLRQSQVAHNVYKTDVFSLGVTLLSLAALNLPTWPPQVEITNELIGQKVEELTFSSKFKDLLREMMEVTEGKRMDFIQLEDRIRPQSEPIPAIQPAPKNAVPQPEMPHCLSSRCGKAVNLSNKDVCSKVVHLYCKPHQHLFCNLTCFKVWAYSQQVKGEALCPACQAPAAEAIENYMDTRPSTPQPSLPAATEPLLPAIDNGAARCVVPSQAPISTVAKPKDIQLIPVSHKEAVRIKADSVNKSAKMSFKDLCCCCFKPGSSID